MLELCTSEERTEEAILSWRSPDLSTRLSVTDMRRSSPTEPTVVWRCSVVYPIETHCTLPRLLN
jgi:hypothetical protein